MMLGERTAAWANSGGGGVPWDYRVEYLDSNNTGAAIRIDKRPTSSNIILQCRCLFYTLGKAGGALGYNKNWQTGWGVGEYNNSTFWVTTGDYYNGCEFKNISRIVKGSIYDLKLDLRTSPYKFYYNNNSYNINKKDDSPLSKTNYIYLFGRSCTETSTPDAMNGRIYSASIIENNEYIINLIPCVKNGVPAMYDTTDGQFHYRFGIGKFVAGPRVSDEL